MMPNEPTIKQMREAIGLTQAELAQALGVARWTYARWELGQQQPHQVFLERLREMYTLSMKAEETADDGV